MSISLEEARKKLDILDELASDPKLILTELFSAQTDGLNFLYQIKINDKSIFDYLEEYLSTITVFQDCIIDCNSSYNSAIKLQPLNYETKYSNYIQDDIIVSVNFDEKSFKRINRATEDYKKSMNKEYTKDLWELSDMCKRFDNSLNMTNRIKIIGWNLCNHEKRFYIKLIDIFYMIILTKARKSKFKSFIQKEKDRTNNHNENEEKYYSENIKKKEFYNQYAPDHIHKIFQKQNEISKYLLSIGYKELKSDNIYSY